MILSDRDLVRRIRQGDKLAYPIEDCQIQPASIDVRLGDDMLWSTPDGWNKVRLSDWVHVCLNPGDFALGTTVECVEVPDDLLCLVHGRSSTGRQGLIVETAGLVDPGFVGEITLELTNISKRPIALTSGMGIAQLTFQRLTCPTERPYGADGLRSRYQHQAGPTLPRDHR